MSLCWALTVVLCLPDGICHSPQAREDKEDGQLGRVRAPQEEDDNAKKVDGSTWSENARQDGGRLPLCLRWPGPQVLRWDDLYPWAYGFSNTFIQYIETGWYRGSTAV